MGRELRHARRCDDAEPVAHCTTAGVSTVTLTVSDGDCTDTGTVASSARRLRPRPRWFASTRSSRTGAPRATSSSSSTWAGRGDIWAGWTFRDNDDTHDHRHSCGDVLPPVAPRSDEVVGGGASSPSASAPDSALLYDTSDTLVDSYTWTAHATVDVRPLPEWQRRVRPTQLRDQGRRQRLQRRHGRGGGGVGARGRGRQTGAAARRARWHGRWRRGNWRRGARRSASTRSSRTAALPATGSSSRTRHHDRRIDGWGFRDNDTTHAIATCPQARCCRRWLLHAQRGTAASRFPFGLGGMSRRESTTRLARSSIRSHWTAHATTTYGRCPNGTARSCRRARPRVQPTIASGGTGGSAAQGGGGAGMGGARPAAGASAASRRCRGRRRHGRHRRRAEQFASNLSGLFYEPATATSPPVLWAVQNGPSLLFRLVWDSATSTWVNTRHRRLDGGQDAALRDRARRPRLGRRHQGGARVVGDLRRHRARQPGERREPPGRAALRHRRRGHRADRDERLEPHRRPAGGGRESGHRGDHLDPGRLSGRQRLRRRDHGRRVRPDRVRGPRHGPVLRRHRGDGQRSTGTRSTTRPAAFQRVATHRQRQRRRDGPGVRPRRRQPVGVLRQHLRQSFDGAARRRDRALRAPALLRVVPRRSPTRTTKASRSRPRASASRGTKSFFWSDDSNFGTHALRRGSIVCGSLP